MAVMGPSSLVCHRIYLRCRRWISRKTWKSCTSNTSLIWNKWISKGRRTKPSSRLSKEIIIYSIWRSSLSLGIKLLRTNLESVYQTSCLILLEITRFRVQTLGMLPWELHFTKLSKRTRLIRRKINRPHTLNLDKITNSCQQTSYHKSKIT